ncbi:MAG: DUF2750 domain-containing protein [Planctomycetota bacterium]|nr:DUF2750 domain-containing protein [Planctomycetota bacterium]
MSIAAAQAAKFYEQVAREGKVFTFQDELGHLVFRGTEGDAVPFWSSRSRLETIQKRIPRYRKFRIVEEALAHFLDETMSMLARENVHVGVNWSGATLKGYDISVDDLRRNIGYWIERLQRP